MDGVLKCSRPPITFLLEPWGEVYTMEPQAHFRLRLQSSVPPSPRKAVDIRYDVGSLTVYGWEGLHRLSF